MWVRNLTVVNAIVPDPIDQVSDHNLIRVQMEAGLVERQQIQL